MDDFSDILFKCNFERMQENKQLNTDTIKYNNSAMRVFN